MIIIQRNSEQINQFIEHLMPLESEEQIQRFVQNYYSIACHLFMETLVDEATGLYYFQFANTDRPVPVSMIMSTNKRDFVLSPEIKVSLRLYQIRSKDRHHFEDVLVEPLFPGFKASLSVIYDVLRAKPHSRVASNSFDQYAVVLTNNMRHDIRSRFTTRWKAIFPDRDMPLDSFEEFYNAIHHLTEEQVSILFKKMIVFVRTDTQLLHDPKIGD